jgi:hypothetical protein
LQEIKLLGAGIARRLVPSRDCEGTRSVAIRSLRIQPPAA